MRSVVADFILAIAQVFLGILMAGGFLGVIYTLIFFHGTLDPVSNTLLTGLAGVLGTIVTQQSGYFFQRNRPPTLPDPSTTSSTTTTTTTPTPTLVPKGTGVVPPAAIIPLVPQPPGDLK
jgi:hypothetical protein